MDFAAIKAVVRDRLFEGGATTVLGGGGLLADLDRIVNDGYTMLYNDMADRAPSLFAETSADLTYDPAVGIALTSTLLGKGLHLLKGIEVLDAQGVWMPLVPMLREEVGPVGGTSIGVSGTAPSTGYWIENFKVFLTPRPSSSQTCRVLFVPTITELDADADVPFAGLFANFHVLIAYEAIILANDKDGDQTTLYRTYHRMKKQLDNYLSSLQRQRPRRIRRTDDDYEWD